MYSHLANTQMNQGEYGKVNASLQTIRHSANEVIGKLDDLVWSVRSDHISLNKLVEKLFQFGHEMCYAKAIEFRTNMRDLNIDIELSEEQNYQLYLFLKEAINNAVKYSGAGVLELMVHLKSGCIEFTVSDDGKGLDISNMDGGNGIRNMKRRAAEIGAQFDLQSGLGKGVFISLVIKYPNAV